MNFGIGLVITIGCILGGYAALGGHLEVLVQPYEFVIIAGSSLGIFIVANSTSTIKDCGKAFVEAVLDKAPKPRDFLDVLSALHALMRELRAKSRSEVEAHFDNPGESEIFKAFPRLLADKDLVNFICDYGRLIIIGNARTHEIEALMDEEIETLAHDRYKPVHAFQAVADGLPALGIVAAVLGIIHAMGALDQSPEVLGGLIGAALVGTFAGIFLSYAIVAPVGAEDPHRPPEAAAAVHHREAKPARLHERRHAAGRRRVRPQDDSLEGASDHRRGRKRDDARRRRRGRDQGGCVSRRSGRGGIGPWRAQAARRHARAAGPRHRTHAGTGLRARTLPRGGPRAALAARFRRFRRTRRGARDDAVPHARATARASRPRRSRPPIPRRAF